MSDNEKLNKKINLDDLEIMYIVNEDGTIYDPPKNPLIEKWEKKYPPIKDGKPCCGPILGYKNDGTPIANYSCILCHEEKCIHSDYWKVPEEDKEEYEKYLKEFKEYYNKHNPNSLGSKILDMEEK